MTDTPANTAPEKAETSEIVEVNFQGLPIKLRASTDPEAAQRRILERLFASNSIEEAFDVWEGQSSEDLEGRTFTITGVRWAPYTRPEDGEKIPLAEVSHVDEDGEELRPFVTTAANLVGFLLAAEQGGWFPFTARVVGEKTSRNRTALRFARV